MRILTVLWIENFIQVVALFLIKIYSDTTFQNVKEVEIFKKVFDSAMGNFLSPSFYKYSLGSVNVQYRSVLNV